MSYELKNRLRGPSTLTVIDGTVTLNLSQLSANTNTENVNSAYITTLKWAVQPTIGTLVITRTNVGSPANIVANLSQAGDWKHDELAIANSATGNLTVTITGGGMCVIGIKKDCTYNVEVDKL